MMDNRVFNINGSGKDMLLRTLELVFEQSSNNKAVGFMVKPKKGLILFWYQPSDVTTGFVPFLCGGGPKVIIDQIWHWLENVDYKSITSTEQFDQHYHDGDVSNGKGWRVYCEDWGHVDSMTGTICAIRPSWLWYGK